MNRRKTAWIPIALLLIPALLFLFFTAWMSSAEYDPSSGAFSDRVLFPGGLSERLTETRFWSDLFNTLLLRLGTLIPGCALGWLLGLGIRKNASPLPRGAAVSLLSVFLFLPPQLLLSLPPLSLIGPLSVRCAAVLALPVFSLSLFCAAVLPDRHKKTAALVPLMTGLFFGLSPDLNAVLSAASSATGFGTLDAWAVGLMKNGAYTASAQVSLIKTVPECAAAVLAALLMGLMASKPQDAPNGKIAGGKALAGTLIALVLSLLILVPSLLSLSSVSGVFASEAFRQSVIAAAVSFVLALIVSAALLMTMPRGKGMMCVLAAALTLLSAFSAAKCALAEQASLSPALASAFYAAFSPLTLSLLVCLIVLSPEGVLPRLRGALICAAVAGARGYFSLLPGEVFSAPALGAASFVSWRDGAVFVLLLCPLILYVLSAFLMSAFASPAGSAKKQERIVLSQGWTAGGGGAAAAALPDAPARAPAEPDKAPTPAPAPVIRTAVPARSDYARQFVQSRAPHPAPEVSVSVSVPDREPETEEAERDPYSRPSSRPVPVAENAPVPGEDFLPAPEETVVPRETEIPEDAPPSPAQIVSMINSLTRMRSLGIMNDEEYREKYDRLMKMM